MLRTSLEGAWVTGVPAGARVVTLGQGFVGEGERVTPTEVEEGRGAGGEVGERAAASLGAARGEGRGDERGDDGEGDGGSAAGERP